MSRSSFLTELFDPSHWPVEFSCPASGEVRCCSTFLHLHYAASHGFWCHVYRYGYRKKKILFEFKFLQFNTSFLFFLIPFMGLVSSTAAN